MTTNAPTDVVNEMLGELRAKLANLEGGEHNHELHIKLMRRKNMSVGFNGTPELVATLGRAVARHAATPEQWIPKLAGGGNYLFYVNSAADPMKPLVGPIPFSAAGEPQPLNIEVMRSSGWAGPGEIIYPDPRDLRPAAPSAPYQAAQQLAPSGPSSHWTAPQSHAPGAGAPGGHFHPGMAPGGMPGAWGPAYHGYGMPPPSPYGNPWGHGPDPFTLMQQQQQRERELQREADQRVREVQQDAERRLEAVRREADDRAARLEQKIEALAATANRPPEKSVGATIAEVVVGVTPLVAPLLASMAENQKEIRLATLRSADQQQAQFRELMQVLTSKPQTIPEIAALTAQLNGINERIRANELPAHAMLGQVTQAISGMVAQQMEMARFVAESSGAPAEHPMLQAFRETLETVKGIAQSYSSAGLPPARLESATQPPRAAPVQAQHAPQHQPPPADGQGFAGYGEGQRARPSEAVVDAVATEVPGVVRQLVQMVREKRPPAEVADALVQNFRTREFQAALEAANGDILAVFLPYLGEFVTDQSNQGYINALVGELRLQGTRAGIFNEPAPEAGAEAA